jgi:hypothetical protein
MASISKTIIPFKNSQTALGNGLPGAAESVVLFQTSNQGLTNLGSVFWFDYAICPNTNATGNSVTGEFSVDGGTTWVNFYTSASNEPVGDSSTFIDEIYVGMFQDIRIKFNNGAAAQTSFSVAMSITGGERSTAGI